MSSGEAAYGVIAYIPTPGRLPHDDEAHFDGWYFIRSWAEGAFEDFRQRYPTAIVSLVEQREIDWRDGNGVQRDDRRQEMAK
jgi:hypothetical protein